jgi:hypothetical protein
MRPKFRLTILATVTLIALSFANLNCSQKQETGKENAANTANQPAAGQPASGQTAEGQQAAGQAPGQNPAAESQQPAGQPSGDSPPPAGQPASPDAAAADPQPPPPPPPPRTFTLASGRSIGVYTASTLSSKANKTGESFVCTLSRSIVDGDWVIAEKGATVEGRIVNSDPGGRVKGVASITVALTRLTLADGRSVSLSTSSFSKRAKSTKKKDAVKIGAGAGIGAAIGAIAGGGKGAGIGAAIGGGAGTATVLATRGDPAVIPGESQLTFKLRAPVTVTKQ